MTRLYRLALRAFARRHRDLHGVTMIDAFDRELAARAGPARLSCGEHANGPEHTQLTEPTGVAVADHATACHAEGRLP